MVEKQNHNIIPKKDNLVDPEPISIALAMFGALIGGANLIVNLARLRRERRRTFDSFASDFLRADRSLNSLDESYRNLVSIYHEHRILEIPFSPGLYEFYVDRSSAAEVTKIRQSIFDAGRNLQKALEALPYSELKEDKEYYKYLLDSTNDLFNNSLRAEYMFNFLFELGLLIIFISEFLNKFGHQLGLDHEPNSSSGRRDLIHKTLDILKEYKKNR